MIDKNYYFVVWVCISLMMNDVELLFNFLEAIYILLPGKFFSVDYWSNLYIKKYFSAKKKETDLW